MTLTTQEIVDRIHFALTAYEAATESGDPEYDAVNALYVDMCDLVDDIERGN